MKRLMIVALAVGALFLGACSNDRAGTPTSGGVAPEAAKPGADQGSLDKGGAVTATSGPVEGRALIYRADITVRVGDVEAVAGQVTSLATTLGGHVSSEKRSTGSQAAQATITIRVPSKNFESAMEKIGDLGTELSRGSNIEDVTEAVVDLDTRILAQKASVEAVRKMYERATTLNELVLLENQLSQRQAELASLEAKKRRLDDLVALSTITVSLIGPNTELPVEKKRSPGFLGGLEAGWDAFVTAVQILLVVIGFMLPFLIAAAIPIVAIVWWTRRRRRQTPSGPAAP